MTGTEIRRRFLLLTALRWLPTGLLIPVHTLLMVDRGLSLAQIGLVAAVQGGVIVLLELPTGGLADAIGRRRVLVAATVIEIASMAVFVSARSVGAFAVAFALSGIYRALESGPLGAWYVDAVQREDPDADIETGLAHAGSALGAAISVGSVGTSLLILAPIGGVDPLVVPILVGLVLRVVEVVALRRLLTDDAPPDRAPDWTVRDGVREVPAVIAGALRLVRQNRVLAALLVVEVLWGAGMVSFETHTPVRLADLSGDTATGAAAFGPASAAGWLVSAAASAAIPRLSRRLRPQVVAAVMRIVQGLTVAGIALAAGPAFAIVAFVATMGVHGAANVVHQGLLHRTVIGPSNRATILSVNSLLASVGGIVGGIALGVLADVDLVLSMLVGAGVLAVAFPLYLLGGRDRPDAARVYRAPI